jgi:hypothetical protein
MSKIILKKSAVIGKQPVANDLDYGELAINYADSKLYFKKSDNTIGTIGEGTGGGGSANSALQYRSSYTAASEQKIFPATYIPGYVDVFLNGVRLKPGIDFTATNGSSITLVETAVLNDSVEIIGYVTTITTLPNALQNRYSYTASLAQTTFAAVYIAPYIDVYKNGVRLSLGDDFIANDSTTVVLTTGAALNDLIEIIGYTSNTDTVAQADKLTTGRTIEMTGDVSWTSGSFNGTANVTGTSTLATTGVVAGTYTKITVDAKGRVTTGSTLLEEDLPASTGGGSAGTEYTANTTNATLTTIATIPVTANTMILVIADIVARRTDVGATDVAAWRIRGVARRTTGNATDVGQVYEEVIARTNASLFVDVESSSANVTVKVQGIAAQNYSWKAVVQTVEI